MRHFSAGDWVDSVRNLLSGERKAAMWSHLEQRCPECIAAQAFWTKVATFFSREAGYTPPISSVRDAERLFTIEKPKRGLSSITQWADCIFDSFRQPATAFVRGRRGAGRHFIYEAKPYVIDFKAEPDVSTNRLSLIGQILDADNPELLTQEIEIVLLNGEDVLAKTTASSGGEFAIDCERQGNLQMFVHVRGTRAIGVALRDLDI